MKKQTFEGHSGQPKVSVDHSVLERFGEPQADYDALEDLFFGTFNIPRKEDEPVVHLYQSRARIRLGHHTFSSNTVHVNAAPGGRLIDPLPALLHETKHMSDRYNKLPQALGVIAMRTALMGGLAELNILIGNPPWAVGIAGVAGIALTYLSQDPLEKQALAAGHDEELLKKYADIITFEDTPSITEV